MRKDFAYCIDDKKNDKTCLGCIRDLQQKDYEDYLTIGTFKVFKNGTCTGYKKNETRNRIK